MGPVLYIMPANTYPSVLTGGCTCHLLADDSTTELDSDVSELPDSLDTLQLNLADLESWSSGVGLVLNPRKIVLICFGTASALAVWHGMDPSVTVCGVVVRPSREFKYLGVWLSEDLSWGRQARMLSARCITAIRSIARFRGALSPGVRRMLAGSLALVHLDFCTSIFTSADARTMKMLQVAQNACIRYICDVPRFGHVSEFRRRLAFLRPADRTRLKCLVSLHMRDLCPH